MLHVLGLKQKLYSYGGFWNIHILQIEYGEYIYISSWVKGYKFKCKFRVIMVDDEYKIVYACNVI